MLPLLPTSFPEENPVATINIAKGKKTIVTNDPSQRYYYLMVFNNRYRVRVAARNVNIPGIQNFRDLGGYKSAGNRQRYPLGECYTVLHRLTAFHLCSRQGIEKHGHKDYHRFAFGRRTP